MLIAQFSFGASLTNHEVKEIKEEIQLMYSEFEKGNIEILIEKTHESIYPLAGGKENFEKITKAAVDQLMQVGVKFIESELGTPTEIYPAGKYEVCFIPRISVMEVQGQKAKSIGFMIAARTKGESVWKYLDGSGIRQNPQLLSMLFPDLDPNIELPTNTIEKL